MSNLQIEGCLHCTGPHGDAARSIMARLSTDHSFAALWKRLDQAERDRDRMLNALQLTKDAIIKDKVNRHTLTIINRALSRIHPVRPA